VEVGGVTATLIPVNEPQRLDAVRRYDVLDTPPDGAFERVTAMAARLFGVPISIVSIVDSDRIWFKSHHGLDVDEIGREPGLCASAILQDGPWLVTDAASDPRTLANPLVAGEFGLRFYAGVPLTTHDGYNLGTLCVIDREPRQVSDAEVATLRDLASVVMDELELRLSARHTAMLQEQLRQQAEEVARTLQDSLLPAELPKVPGLDLQARYHVADRGRVGGDFYDVFPSEAGVAVVVGDACGKGAKAAALTGTARWCLRTVALGAWTPAQALHRLNEVIVRGHDSPERYATLALASVQPLAGGGADLTLALAGHPHPLVLRRDGTIDAIGVTAPVAGWLPDVTYTDVTVQLGRGDILVMFTDGTLDVISGRGSMDDTHLRSLLTAVPGRTATQVAETLDERLSRSRLSDDAAFLVIQPT
jgi:sigma-B regulation protein RsbU (phosphoserine phosphatase)